LISSNHSRKLDMSAPLFVNEDEREIGSPLILVYTTSVYNINIEILI